MKKLILAIVAIVAVSVLAGCVKMNMNTTLQGNGAGALDLTFAFAPGVLDALKDLAASGGGMGTDKMPDLSALDRSKLEESCRRAGVTLAAYERTNVGGREQTHVKLDFKRFDDLNAVLEPSGNAHGGLGLYKLPNGNYTIRVSGDEKVAAADAKRAAEEATKAAEDAARAAKETAAGSSSSASNGGTAPDSLAVQKSMAAIGKLIAAAGELDMSLRFTVPGDVISNNAMRVEGRTLIWEINSQNMMTEASNMQPEIVFSGKGLNIDAPLWTGGTAKAGAAAK